MITAVFILGCIAMALFVAFAITGAIQFASAITDALMQPANSQQKERFYVRDVKTRTLYGPTNKETATELARLRNEDGSIKYWRYTEDYLIRKKGILPPCCAIGELDKNRTAPAI